MPALALRVEEPTFRNCIESYVENTCRQYRVRTQDVDDLVQETLTNIITSIDSFRPEDGEFEPWAKGVALNVIRRYMRDAKRYFDRFSEYYPNVHDYPSHECSPELCAQRKQARSSISSGLQNLTAKQVFVVVSFDVYDASYADIGEELGISAGASQQCHERALNKLARCIPHDLLSVMPLDLAGCDEPISSNENGSRWTERSHYASQVIGSIVALLLLVPACFEPQSRATRTEDARVLGSSKNAAMHSSDQPSDVHDEPVVHRDAPSVKPEPASLTSVRAVSTPAKVIDKRADVEDLAPLPPYKPKPNGSDHRLRGR